MLRNLKKYDLIFLLAKLEYNIKRLKEEYTG